MGLRSGRKAKSPWPKSSTWANRVCYDEGSASSLFRPHPGPRLAVGFLLGPVSPLSWLGDLPTGPPARSSWKPHLQNGRMLPGMHLKGKAMRSKVEIDQKPLYNEATISEIYRKNLARAEASLRKLEVFCCEDCKLGELSGWVFEQTVRYCLQKEFAAQGLQPNTEEQRSLGGKLKANLAIGGLAIQIKLSDVFAVDQLARYGQHRRAAEEKGLQYLLLTAGASYPASYRRGLAGVVGSGNVFFFDEPMGWERFVKRIVAEVRPSRQR